MTLAMLLPFTIVAMVTLIMSVVTYIGTFDHVTTELGSDHYAEKCPEFLSKFVPESFTMPMNTLVNIGYIMVGAYYSAVASVRSKQQVFSAQDCFMFYLFNFGAAFYGVIQTLRILTQMHKFAVMDQWYTLPLFNFVFIWSKSLTANPQPTQSALIMALSLTSYCLAVWTEIGFEIALAFHIFVAVIGGVTAYRKFPATSAPRTFFGALLSCVGFVVFKLLDLELPKYHSLFTFISGHFISKIADILQIYYVNVYFEALTLHKNKLKAQKSD
ncbi:hypothetical protein FSP39_013667 [Pinctada imbricata]|uniref:Transmembrane protein n=1 Tax=Pinctada imbricata TaxID=66713 RepID=A0AA89C7J2_PINIB|nr:hypothetical protein FSP39_013667 [Pinctada imbricata]